MFHGVMLSYKFRKQFWFSEDPYRKHKLAFFIKKLNLGSQNIKFLGENKINYKIRDKKFNSWKKKSVNFLLKNIKKSI